MGAIQAAAARSRLRGLLIIPHPRAAYALGALIPAAALAWFALSGRTAIPGDVGGVEGAQQFTLFSLAAGAATVVTALIASFTQWRRPLDGEPEAGMEGLRHGTLLQLIRRRLYRQRPVPTRL